MTAIDWLLLAAYLVLTLVLGLWLARRNSGEADYFVAGRRLNGWLAGASMAATTFSIDTPLYVAGLVGARGLAGNWEWWSFGLAHVAMAVVFAPLWRRSGVLTDAAFTELRYGGAAAAWLRGIKAFLLAVPVNCIGIGYAFLALRKVVEALGLVSGQPAALGLTDTVWLLMVVALLVMSYTVAGGLWAVVVTDLVQLVLALAGALAVAAAALHAAGGMTALLEQLQALQRPELLSLVPWTWDDAGFHWLQGSGISIPMFTAYIAVQWWSFRRSDGGGEFIQRMLATRDEQQARLAGWVFLVVNYLLRSWLWIVVALAAQVLLPAGADLELGYPALAVQLLPPVALGLVVISLVAAFMSTVSTSVNWGASYLTHDLYQRFVRPSAGSRELLLVGQLTTVLRLFRWGVHLGGAPGSDRGLRGSHCDDHRPLRCGLVDGDAEHTAGIGRCLGAVCADGASSGPRLVTPAPALRRHADGVVARHAAALCAGLWCVVWRPARHRRLPAASTVEWLDRSVGADPLDLAVAAACRCRALLSRMTP
ncbi:sodium:solute symporter family/ possibly glucose transporter [Synechococcus sp. RS9907]|nr:sodium:solute symporter family/ possibly glucose transporter [Synechococcus sp. RS9907]